MLLFSISSNVHYIGDIMQFTDWDMEVYFTEKVVSTVQSAVLLCCVHIWCLKNTSAHSVSFLYYT
jgi:hypothetical protein